MSLATIPSIRVEAMGTVQKYIESNKIVRMVIGCHKENLRMVIVRHDHSTAKVRPPFDSVPHIGEISNQYKEDLNLLYKLKPLLMRIGR